MIVHTITFSVVGRPVTKGSKTVHMRGETPVLVERTDMKSKTRPRGELTRWMHAVSAAGIVAINRAGVVLPPEGVWMGPVALSALFVLPIPPSYLLKSGRIKKGHSPVPTSPPDLDKLVRAVKDACSGVIYKDDAQVVRYRAPFGKRWASPGGVGGVFLEFDFLTAERPEWEPAA